MIVKREKGEMLKSKTMFSIRTMGMLYEKKIEFVVKEGF